MFCARLCNECHGFDWNCSWASAESQPFVRVQFLKTIGEGRARTGAYQEYGRVGRGCLASTGAGCSSHKRLLSLCCVIVFVICPFCQCRSEVMCSTCSVWPPCVIQFAFVVSPRVEACCQNTTTCLFRWSFSTMFIMGHVKVHHHPLFRRSGRHFKCRFFLKDFAHHLTRAEWM